MDVLWLMGRYLLVDGVPFGFHQRDINLLHGSRNYLKEIGNVTLYYHGTSMPEDLVWREGLRIFTPNSLRDYMLRLLGTPDKLRRTLERAIKLAWMDEYVHPGYLWFTSDSEEASGYSEGPTELVDGVLDKLPKGLRDRLWDFLSTLGEPKLLEVDIPDSWLSRPGVVRQMMGGGESEEIGIPWDVGPQYIKRIIPLQER